jgi:hypothetical protein
MTNGSHARPLVDQGPDDFIVRMGDDAFRALVNDALPFDSAARVAKMLATLEDPADILDDLPLMLQLGDEPESSLTKVSRLLRPKKVSEKAVKNAAKFARAAYNACVRDGSAGGAAMSRFLVRDARTYRRADDPTKPPELVAHFAASIVRQVRVHRGEAPSMIEVSIHVEAPQGAPTTIQLPAARLKDATWVFENLGASGAIVDGPKGYGMLVEAIQTLSEPELTDAYGATGIVNAANGDTFFVHSGGAIGADGIVPQFPSYLQKYELSVVDDPDQLREAIRHVLSFIEVADERVTFAILGFVFRSLLAKIAPVPFALFLVGTTGTRKTSLAEAAMLLFGSGWSNEHFLSFSSTANYLETVMHMAADVVLVIDDFVKAATSNPRRGDLDELAERLLRSIGNTSSRGRSTADGGTRAELPPRGGVVITGEHAPQGHSIIGRLLLASFTADTVNLQRLSDWKKQRAVPSIVTGAFIADVLLPHLTDLAANMPTTIEALRNTTFSVCKAHSRTATNLAHTFYGLMIFLRYAREVNAIDDVEERKLLARAEQALLQLGAAQTAHVDDADPCSIFLDVMKSLIAQGRAYIVVDGAQHCPPDRGIRLGWANATEVIVDETAAFGMVNDELRKSHRAQLPSLSALRVALVAKGIAMPGQASRAHRSQHTLESGLRIGVIRFPTTILYEDAGWATAVAPPATHPGVGCVN